MGKSAWEIVTFTLNAILFTLIGLQLPGILDELDAYAASDLLWWAFVIGERCSWRACSGSTRPRSCRVLVPGLPGAGPSRDARADHLVGDARRRLAGSGARGRKLTIDTGEPFPRARPDPLLPHLRRHLRHARGAGADPACGDPPARARGRRRGRRWLRAKSCGSAAGAAGASTTSRTGSRRHGGRIRGGYGFRRDRFSAWLDGGDDGSIESRSRDFQRPAPRAPERRAGGGAGAPAPERRHLGRIARRVERDLDLEDARLEI